MRYVISVESKGDYADDLEQALSIFNKMMCIDKKQVREDVLQTGQSTQVYGFCVGTLYDNHFKVKK